MAVNLINIGFGNIVAANRLIAIVGPDAAPVKRTIQDARTRNVLTDATCGRRCRAVLVMDTGQIVLSAIQPETIAGRLKSGGENE